MSMFKRTAFAAIALSFLAVPMAQAGPGPSYGGYGNHYYQPKKPAPPPYGKRHHRWKKGDRVQHWHRRAPVRSYHQHRGLWQPQRGQHWVKVDNDYLLISLATGIIAGIVAGR